MKAKKRQNSPDEWLQNADLLYLGSRALYKCGSIYLWIPATHLICQCVEQYLKSYLKFKKVDFSTGNNGHLLTALYELCCTHGVAREDEIYEFIENLNKLYQLRYMDNIFDGDGIGEDELKQLDVVVATVRPLILALNGYDFLGNLPVGSLEYEILIWNNSCRESFNLII